MFLCDKEIEKAGERGIGGLLEENQSMWGSVMVGWQSNMLFRSKSYDHGVTQLDHLQMESAQFLT
jgi:hypothetical protein